jgi:hypothetical protein
VGGPHCKIINILIGIWQCWSKLILAPIVNAKLYCDSMGFDKIVDYFTLRKKDMSDEKYLIRIEASMKLDLDIYRGGNSTSPRFDNVRDKDIVKFQDPATGLTKVKGMSGGISTFTSPKPETNWWWIKAGTVVPPGLTVTRDETNPKTGITHYTIRPASDMLLTDYINQMCKFIGVERLPIEQAILRGGRWINV